MRLSQTAVFCALLALFASPVLAQLVPAHTPELVYPQGATGSAEIFVDVIVEPDGSISEAHIVRRVPENASPAFDGAVEDFCRELRFEEFLVDGEPGRVQTRLRLEFIPPPNGHDHAAVPASEKAPSTDPASLDRTANQAASDRTAPEQTSSTPLSSDGSSPSGTAPGSGEGSEDREGSEGREDVDAIDSTEFALDPSLSPFVTHVRGSRAPLSSSDFHIHVGKLADVPRRTAAELLTLAPGVLLTNHGSEGHANSIFLRGFDAGEGQDLEFKLDGIPLNDISNPHGHGYAETHFIIPELVDEVRVVEGPFDPRQGDFAVAGSAEYHLGLHERGSRIQISHGSFDTRRLLALWGPQGEQVGTFAGLDLRQGDGFGINRGHSSASLLAQYEAVLGPRTRLFVLGQSYAGHFESAGLIRDDDFRASRLPCGPGIDEQFFCTYDTSQGGASSRHGLSARLVRRQGQSALEQQIFFATRDLRIRENLTGWLLDPSSSGAPQRGDGIEQAYQSATLGLRGSYRLRVDWLKRRHDVEVGYIARYDQADSSAFRLRNPGGGAWGTLFDNQLRVANLGLYTAATFRPFRRITLRGGLRADTFSFSVLDRNQPSSDGHGERLPFEHVDSFGVAVQPRGSVAVRLSEDFNWVTSVGVGTRSTDAGALSANEAAPFARVTSAETGLLFERPAMTRQGWSLEGRASAFTSHVDRDLVFDEEMGRNTFAGASNRFGALLHARAGLGGWLDMQGSFTWTEAFLAEDEGSWYALTAGERMPYIPRLLTRFDAVLRRTIQLGKHELPSSLAIGATHIGARPLPRGKYGEPVFLVDLALRTRWRALEFGLEARNVLNARWREAEYDFPSNFTSPDLPPSLRSARHFIAGEPRMFLATIALHFGGGPFPSDHDDVHPEETR